MLSHTIWALFWSMLMQSGDKKKNIVNNIARLLRPPLDLPLYIQMQLIHCDLWYYASVCVVISQIYSQLNCKIILLLKHPLIPLPNLPFKYNAIKMFKWDDDYSLHADRGRPLQTIPSPKAFWRPTSCLPSWLASCLSWQNHLHRKNIERNTN